MHFRVRKLDFYNIINGSIKIGPLWVQKLWRGSLKPSHTVGGQPGPEQGDRVKNARAHELAGRNCSGGLFSA